MNYQSVDEIFAMIAREHAQFVAALANLSEAQASFRLADDEWTLAEIAEHVSITNSGFLRIGHKLLKGAEAAGAPPLASLDLPPVLLDAEGRQNPKRFPAPEVVKPQGSQTVAESLAKLEAAQIGLAEVLPRLSATDCSAGNFPHPAVGPINVYQWLIVWGEHLNRHQQQIQRVKSAAGFPA